MPAVDDLGQVRRGHRDGLSIRSTARTFHRSRSTVRAALVPRSHTAVFARKTRQGHPQWPTTDVDAFVIGLGAPLAPGVLLAQNVNAQRAWPRASFCLCSEAVGRSRPHNALRPPRSELFHHNREGTTGQKFVYRRAEHTGERTRSSRSWAAATVDPGSGQCAIRRSGSRHL